MYMNVASAECKYLINHFNIIIYKHSFKFMVALLHRVPVHMILFVFVALRPMSTAMVIAGRSVHLTTLFPGQA